QDTSLASDGSQDGPYCYVVHAWDGVQESVDSALVTVTYDTTAPNTTIPTAPPLFTRNLAFTWGFASTEPSSTFECRLDSTNPADFVSCPQSDSVSVGATGPHTLDVRATDRAGNTDATPA